MNNSLSDGGPFYDTEMDGLTFVLTCASSVTPDQTNHMKLAIADASDHVFDSAVFLRAGSITTERIPVILIPGMGASFNIDCFFKEQSCNVDQEWDFFPIKAEGVYSPLIDRLEEADYTEDNYYFSIFHYDWRKQIEENVGRLKEHIDEIKEKADEDKVDLIGHSMGGLLARAYVQSDAFEDDVAHVVTLGSPHQGAAKAYPYWQAAHIYEMGWFEGQVISIILKYYTYKEKKSGPVLVLREKIPSFKDILPVFDDPGDQVVNYLYKDDTNAAIPESTMNHQNTFLPKLNSDVDTFFDRTEVATYVGQDRQTTARFYVDDWTPEDKSNWVDGKPNWDRQSDFYSNNGDGTVLVLSGKLEGAEFEDFSGVEHLGLPGNNDVINGIFAYLGITVAPPPSPSFIPKIIIFILDGAAQAIITDPLGRSLIPPGPIEPDRSGVISDTIPGAEYIQVPDDTFQIIMIPEPVSGDYQIGVNGVSEGDFILGRLDTFTDTLGIPAPAESFWDTSESQIQPSTTLTNSMSYSETAQAVSDLIAITPVIELPVWMGNTDVTGRGQPGVEVTIHDVESSSVLGTVVVGANGHFTIALTQPLVAKQKIYPTANGQTGSIVTVDSFDIFLPLSIR